MYIHSWKEPHDKGKLMRSLNCFQILPNDRLAGQGPLLSSYFAALISACPDSEISFRDHTEKLSGFLKQEIILSSQVSQTFCWIPAFTPITSVWFTSGVDLVLVEKGEPRWLLVCYISNHKHWQDTKEMDDVEMTVVIFCIKNCLQRVFHTMLSLEISMLA